MKRETEKFGESKVLTHAFQQAAAAAASFSSRRRPPASLSIPKSELAHKIVYVRTYIYIADVRNLLLVHSSRIEWMCEGGDFANNFACAVFKSIISSTPLIADVTQFLLMFIFCPHVVTYQMKTPTLFFKK
jgi:hypothetical protein